MSKLTIYLSREKCFYPFHQTSRNGGSDALTDLPPPLNHEVQPSDPQPITLSAHHLYGNPEITGRIQMERFIPGDIFQKKSNTFRVITFFPFLPKRPKLSVPFVWITSARLYVQRKRKLYRYFVTGTTQSRSCFRCQKNTSTIWWKFSSEISMQIVSAHCVQLP